MNQYTTTITTAVITITTTTTYDNNYNLSSSARSNFHKLDAAASGPSSPTQYRGKV